LTNVVKGVLSSGTGNHFENIHQSKYKRRQTFDLSSSAVLHAVKVFLEIVGYSGKSVCMFGTDVGGGF
jgi:hypothetical protein